ncbi:MAG: HAD family hydrolase [Anaerolineae bacterium]|nr:HAD family hydrolase [Anaerolineae bacterium]MDW8069352.1 HAD family hydrolase [Anaerolineae bacterium]
MVTKRIALILDADDTLWENNIFYEEATDAFAERMAREGFDPQRARETLAHIEHERVPIYGYSPHEFVRCLVLTYRQLCQEDGHPPHPEVEREVEAIGQRVVEYPILLLDGVAETMAALSRYCRLFLLTKGDPEVQQSKVERSGLSSYFEAIHIVPEKGPEVLQGLLAHHNLDPQRTWMVGNSPRSDVNPALAVGIGAIHIPYHRPWSFEEVPVADPERVVTLSRFADLLHLFPGPEETP